MIKIEGEKKYVELVHPGGTREFVPVESYTRDVVSLWWGLSGTYDLCLKTNTIKSRSLKARRKGQCFWKAVDIDSVRKFVYEGYHPKEKETLDKQYEKHVNSMPYTRAKTLSQGK